MRSSTSAKVKVPPLLTDFIKLRFSSLKLLLREFYMCFSSELYMYFYI